MYHRTHVRHREPSSDAAAAEAGSPSRTSTEPATPQLPPPNPTVTTTAQRGRVSAPIMPGAPLRGGPWTGYHLSRGAVIRARAKGPAAIAETLCSIICDRTTIVIPDDQARLERMNELLGGLSAIEVDRARSEYIKAYGADPEIHIQSWDLFQPFMRLRPLVIKEMIRALNGAALEALVRQLSELLDRARRAALTRADRAAYFSALPLSGRWNRSARQVEGGPNLDALERTLLKEHWHALRRETSFDEALGEIERAMPPPDLEPRAPRERSIAVIASSHGAQWQELMDWLMVMISAGFTVQVFTPEGRPVSFQEDSLCVNRNTSKLGLGAPEHLDPRGLAGVVARAALATTAPAALFDASNFGAVYAAGGRGFNEDVVVAHVEDGEVVPRAAPHIERMLRAAVDARLPQLALCHAPTIYAIVKAQFADRFEAISAGLVTSALRSVDFDSHRELCGSGGKASRLTLARDILDLSRVTRDEKDGLRLLTGPGPQASFSLGAATIEELRERWRA